MWFQTEHICQPRSPMSSVPNPLVDTLLLCSHGDWSVDVWLQHGDTTDLLPESLNAFSQLAAHFTLFTCQLFDVWPCCVEFGLPTSVLLISSMLDLAVFTSFRFLATPRWPCPLLHGNKLFRFSLSFSLVPTCSCPCPTWTNGCLLSSLLFPSLELPSLPTLKRSSVLGLWRSSSSLRLACIDRSSSLHSSISLISSRHFVSKSNVFHFIHCVSLRRYCILWKEQCVL